MGRGSKGGVQCCDRSSSSSSRSFSSSSQDYVECPPCNAASPAVNRYLLTVSGVSNGTCSNCSFYNGIYIVTHDLTTAGGCRFRYIFPDSACFSPEAGIQLSFNSNQISVFIASSSFSGAGICFITTGIGTTYNCSNLDYTLSQTACAFGGPCLNFNPSASCRVQAI